MMELAPSQQINFKKEAIPKHFFRLRNRLSA